jgi:tetratricopeptide (TPR) repeat protein
VAALVQEANVRMRQNRPQEAEQLLQKARALPQAAPYEAGIVSSLATVAQRGLKDPRKAVVLLRESLRLQPDETAAGQVLLRMGLAFVEAGMPDSAQAALAQAEAHAGADPNLAAQARFISAKVLMGAKQASEGLRRLRSVTADYPRTEAGLQAPLEIVAYYRETGDKAATAATLREAAGEYERLIQELGGTQGQEAVIMTALDRLANVRVGLEDWSGAADVLAQRADGFPGDVGSPLALVQAAAIRETRLQDRQGSIALLKKMVERYPQHPLTPQVKDKITQMGAGS